MTGKGQDRPNLIPIEAALEMLGEHLVKSLESESSTREYLEERKKCLEQSEFETHCRRHYVRAAAGSVEDGVKNGKLRSWGLKVEDLDFEAERPPPLHEEIPQHLWLGCIIDVTSTDLSNLFSLLPVFIDVHLDKREVEQLLDELISSAKPSAEKYRTGYPGRPTIRQLVKQEFNIRCESGLVAQTLAEEARQLSAWAREEHPNVSTPNPRTIENNIREDYRKLGLKNPRN